MKEIIHCADCRNSYEFKDWAMDLQRSFPALGCSYWKHKTEPQDFCSHGQTKN